jgi:hypothetical protein
MLGALRENASLTAVDLRQNQLNDLTKDALREAARAGVKLEL